MGSRELDASSFIKPYEEPPEEQISLKSEKVTPFTFITAVSETKKDIIKENPDIEKDYNAYIVNKGFSYFPDSVLFANELNLHAGIPAISQYYYYMASLRKRKRFSKWHKLEKNEDLELVQRVYNVRAEVGKQYLKILSKEDLDVLRKLTETGENKSKSKNK